MLDTKLKKTHKLAVLIITICILLPSTILVALYPRMEQVDLQQIKAMENEETVNWTDTQMEVSDEFVYYAIEASYYMYGQLLQQSLNEPIDFSVLNEYGWVNDYYTLQEEAQYFAKYYGSAQEKTETNSDYPLERLLDKENTSAKNNLIRTLTKEGYIGYLTISFDAYGNISDIHFNGLCDAMYYGNAYQHATQSIKQYENNVLCYNNSGENEKYVDPMELRPKNFQAVFSIKDDTQFAYMYVADNIYHAPFNAYFDMGAEWLVFAAAIFVMLAALFLPFVKKLQTGKEKLFNLPLEVVLCIAVAAAGGMVFMFEVMTYSSRYIIEEAIKGYGDIKIIGYAITPDTLYGIMLVINYIGWALCFFMEYIVVAAFRQFLCGPIRYLKERWLLIVFLRWVKKKCIDLYHYVTDIRLGAGMHKSIIKIVVVNFLILMLLCCMWFLGIFGLLIYSVALYMILKKQGEKLKKQYESIVYATAQMAEGNLKVELKEELGIFSELGEELRKVQDGFSKAVAEEAKSQSMKTELITNVSHDLKTPLTAIITYVDLLKKENITEDERREYIDTLEKKSMRLKVLIEDLFEVSKATTNNITMYYTDIDLVNLLKQVCLENEDKIKESTLDFRWNLPEKKCVSSLDPNRTYRIMDNLLQNALKYSMPYSRVYIDMEETETEYVICFKNMSATEMNFDVKEITERFVRGDLSRNTEGSGLGLAIAQSFTELQNGKFAVEIDGDLFKVTLRFGRDVSSATRSALCHEDGPLAQS